MNVTLLTQKKPSNFESKLKRKIESKRVSYSLIDPYNFQNVFNLCCLIFKQSPEDVLKVTENKRFTRKQECVYIRFAVKYLLYVNTRLTYQNIGYHFVVNGKSMDHSTVLHAVNKVPKLLHSTKGKVDFSKPFDIVENILRKQYDVYDKNKK